MQQFSTFRRLLVKYALAVFVIFVCAASGSLQAQTAGSSAAAETNKDPVASSLRTLLQRSKGNTLGALSAMPGDKFNYKPTADQMTFAHLAAHIIGFNNSFCAKAADVAPPKVDEAKESDGKDKLVAAATASYDFCAEALGKLDDSKLGDNIELFGGRRAPRAMAALILAGGWSDHYAAAAQYLRLNGILPPSAQPKK